MTDSTIIVLAVITILPCLVCFVAAVVLAIWGPKGSDGPGCMAVIGVILALIGIAMLGQLVGQALKVHRPSLGLPQEAAMTNPLVPGLACYNCSVVSRPIRSLAGTLAS